MGIVRSTVDRWLGRVDTPEVRRATGIYPYSFQSWLESFKFGGHTYPVYGPPLFHEGHKQEAPDSSFAGYVQFAMRTNGVIFACMVARLLLFSEARFQFRRLRNGRPGDLFGTEALRILERPWTNGTTADLLARAIQDVDLAGNFYARRTASTLRRMRPDWVTLVLGSELSPEEPAMAVDCEVLGYIYKPGGPLSGADPIPLLPEEVCHWVSLPDPLARFRGMSWLTPVIREVMADSAATEHKLTFFEKGATPNFVVKGPEGIGVEEWQKFVSLFQERHRDVADAYRTIFLGGGADVQVVGANLEQIDFKVTQGGGETRICAAARVPPIIVGVSEGLDAATYSNYGQARRAFADLTMRPLWRQMAGALEQVVDVPADALLWYDDRDIPFLQEDVKDAADIVALQAQAIRTLTDGGYKSESVVEAVVANDLRLLEHSGLMSVQMRPADGEPPSLNGSEPVEVEA